MDIILAVIAIVVALPGTYLAIIQIRDYHRK